MKRITRRAFAAIVLAFVGSVQITLSLSAQAPSPDSPSIERGRKTYMKHCASCHGDGGRGDGPLASSIKATLQDLTSHVYHHDQATLFQMISRGLPPNMSGYARELDMDEILDLIDYLYTLDDSYQQALAASNATSKPTTRSATTPSAPAKGMDEARCPSERVGEVQPQGGMQPSDPMDAVWLGADLDGDNDPDEIRICLQILEIKQEIAPGVSLPFWVFAPDLGGMQPLAQLPGPTLRVEQGDHVQIVVKNTHYFPHTLHMHGVIKPNAMDGIPGVTQEAIQPGQSFVYDFIAQNPGTQWYHCHVQTPVHLLMGLYGMLIIEPNRPQNFVTPLVMTTRMPELSVASQEAGFDAEYVLTYQDIDPQLNAPLNDRTLSLAQLEQKIHRQYNTTERTARYFVLNGKSFPYTLLDSLVVVKPDEHVLLRVLNAGANVVSLHLHGHHATAVALDGVSVPKAQRVLRDTFTISPAQRVDIDLNTASDGVHASGPGVWLMHDHSEQAITTDGINPGGDLDFIVYDNYVDPYGLPKVSGDLSQYFSPDYYRGDVPVFDGEAFAQTPSSTVGGVGNARGSGALWAWVTLAIVVGVLLGGEVTRRGLRRKRRSA